jgi:hypothetical protein
MIDDDENGSVGGMRIGRGNRNTRSKPASVPLCPPQIPHNLSSNPGRRGWKPATNLLSYGTAPDWGGNITMNRKEISHDDVDWIHLAQNSEQ